MPRPWRPTPHNQIRARTTPSLLNWSEANIRQETSNLPLLALCDRSSISEAHTLPSSGLFHFLEAMLFRQCKGVSRGCRIVPDSGTDGLGSAGHAIKLLDSEPSGFAGC